MVNNFIQKLDRLEKKYDRTVMLLFAIILWTYAIHTTMNLSHDVYNPFFMLHVVASLGLYGMACMYTAIFIFWERFNKPTQCTKH